MEQKIKFSVAMSVYHGDNPLYFDEALVSITERQTAMPDEVVIVVDGPVTQEINEVIESYRRQYSFFKVIRLTENAGLGNALKIALESCTYEVVARMDSDDISVPSRFEEQLGLLRANPEIDIIGGNIAEFIGDQKNVVGNRNVPENNDEIYSYMKKRCPFNHVTVMYKKSKVIEAGGYMDLFWNEDYYLWIRMAEAGCNMANTGTTLVNVRVGEEMYKRRGGSKYFQSECFLQKYMKKRGMISSGRYFINVTIRFIMQILLPNSVRGWAFRTFAREK